MGEKGNILNPGNSFSLIHSIVKDSVYKNDIFFHSEINRIWKYFCGNDPYFIMTFLKQVRGFLNNIHKNYEGWRVIVLPGFYLSFGTIVWHQKYLVAP